MKRLGFLSVLFILVFSCQNDYSKNKQPYKLIPSETSAIIKINELSDFINSIDNNTVLSDIYNKELSQTSQILKNFKTSNPVYIGLTETDSIRSNYLILTENDSTLFVLDSITNLISESLVELNAEKTQIDDHTIYHKVIGNTFVGSNNLKLLKSISLKNENNEVHKLIETTNEKSVASILFNSNTTNYSKLLFTNVSEEEASNFTIIDLDYKDNGLNYNGILTPKDSSVNHLSRFKNTVPQKTNTPSIAPFETSSLTSVSFDDYSVFSNNKSEDSTNIASKGFLNFTNEIAKIDNALILHSLDTHLILETIEGKSHLETFRDIDVFEFDEPEFFKSNLMPFISFENAKYFSIFENFMVFTHSIEALKSILTDALNNRTLSNSEAFQSISEDLSDEASLFVFKNSEGLSKVLGKSMNGYNANAVQFIHEDNYTHINGVIQKFKKKAALNSVVETFTTPLEMTSLTTPQAVKNHVTNAHDIVVQDVNNTLYLISSSGNILWKKQLQGKIIGQVGQIDMYKNGRLQLAFATPNRLYVLDRNGNDVSPFPLKFNDKITQPLSVFDYDNRKDYRLLITQEKNLLMYDAKGQSVTGFDYKSIDAAITAQPKHFRIGTKDYIVFAAGETLKILSRQGSDRINVKDKIRFSDNELYLYQNKFTTSNTLGQLIQVDTKGKLSTENLNLTDKHKITTTSKTLVTLKENRLNIKSRTIDLDYGDYTAPKIFYLNDKIYVTTTDLQSKKVYLFDSQAKSIPNFPVFGTSSAQLEKLDGEPGLELISQSDDKTVIVYKLH